MSLINKILGNSTQETIESLEAKFSNLLIEGEQIELGFKLFRDTFMFTNLRLILVDVQGITGKKVEFKSVPYSKINRFSLETAGSFDLDAELKIWTTGSGMPTVSKKFNKSVNIYSVHQYLATKIL